MSQIFDHNAQNLCCLCGSHGELTGEHRIKASSLASRFAWDESVAIVSADRNIRPKLAQSRKSEHFHYKAPVCRTCNSDRTQQADQEFSRFDEVCQSLAEGNGHPTTVWEDPTFKVGTSARLNTLRYFEKSLACAIAESGGPRFLALTNFAIDRSDEEVVFLKIDRDPNFPRWQSKFSDSQYAAHAGLEIQFSRETNLLHEIRSGISLGAVRYTFSIGVEPVLARALKLHSPKFYGRGEMQFLEASR